MNLKCMYVVVVLSFHRLHSCRVCSPHLYGHLPLHYRFNSAIVTLVIYVVVRDCSCLCWFCPTLLLNFEIAPYSRIKGICTVFLCNPKIMTLVR